MTLYLAGRMRCIPYYNFPAFDAARDALKARGHTVISPADLDREHGFDAMLLPPDYDWSRVPEGFDLNACIRRDVDAVLRCDALVFLSGDWTASIGSKGEFAVALWARKPVFELSPDMETPVEVRAEVWIHSLEYGREAGPQAQRRLPLPTDEKKRE